MNQKGFVNIILVAVIVILIGAVGYFVFVKKSVPTAQQPTPTSAVTQTKNPIPVSILSEQFTYTKNDQLFSVSEREFNVLGQFTSSALKDQSQECGTNKTQQYFKNLLSKYKNSDKGIEYDFQYQGPTQDSGIWVVTVIPNKLSYTNVSDFKKDFDVCAAGADKYPYLVSDKYLLFTSSCGTGSDDGSGKSHGCDKLQEAVESTIKLK